MKDEAKIAQRKIGALAGAFHAMLGALQSVAEMADEIPGVQGHITEDERAEVQALIDIIDDMISAAEGYAGAKGLKHARGANQHD